MRTCDEEECENVFEYLVADERSVPAKWTRVTTSFAFRTNQVPVRTLPYLSDDVVHTYLALDAATQFGQNFASVCFGD